MAIGGVVPGVRRSRNALSPGADVELVLAGGRRVVAGILDVSLSGLRVMRPEGVEVVAGQPVELAFPLDAHAPLQVRATVVRSSADQVAFQFEAGSAAQDDALRALIRRRGQLRDNVD